MILVDTSVWVDHLRKELRLLAEMLTRGQVLVHPFVIGELALGSIRQRGIFLKRLALLPAAEVAHADEVLALIEANGLHASGIGYVDAHLVASARMTPDTQLWTHDQRLAAVANQLGVAFRPHDA